MSYLKNVLLAALMLIGTAAQAMQPDISLSMLHTAEGDQSIIGKERVAMPGDVLFGTTLIQPDLALLARAFNDPIHGLPANLPALGALRRTEVSHPGYYGLTYFAQVYCTTNRKLSGDERKPDLTRGTSSRRPKKVTHFEREVNVCLIDEESDGVFDRAFINGARSEVASKAIQIRPLRYAQVQGTKVNRFLRLEYTGTKSIFGPVVRFKSNLSGGDDETSVWFFEKDGDYEFVNARKGIRGNTFPKRLELGPIVITLLARDRDTSAITYRIDRTFRYQKVNLTISEGMTSITYY